MRLRACASKSGVLLGGPPKCWSCPRLEYDSRCRYVTERASPTSAPSLPSGWLARAPSACSLPEMRDIVVTAANMCIGTGDRPAAPRAELIRSLILLARYSRLHR